MSFLFTSSLSVKTKISTLGLLFATMHTNDSITAVMRFLEFGIPRSSISNVLRVVIAQRLIRLNCTNCLTSYSPSVKTLQEAGIKPAIQNIFKRGTGCGVCYESGYFSRQGIFEIFFIDRDIELLILDGVSYRQLWDAARSKGLKTLRELALQLVFQGKTTLEEAIHTTA